MSLLLRSRQIARTSFFAMAVATAALGNLLPRRLAATRRPRGLLNLCFPVKLLYASSVSWLDPTQAAVRFRQAL